MVVPFAREASRRNFNPPNDQRRAGCPCVLIPANSQARSGPFGSTTRDAADMLSLELFLVFLHAATQGLVKGSGVLQS